jgi:hypothetical protein
MGNDGNGKRFGVPKAKDLRPIGYLLTFIWFGGGALWLLIFSKEGGQSANEWGDVFAGLAAPIAFIWLVLGFLQQGEEFRLSSRALTLQVHELKESVEQQKQLVDASAKAVAASTAHTDTLVKIERAYLTGGGPSGSTLFGQIFRLEVANYGKTPAFLCAIDVHFATLSQVTDGPQEVFPWYPYEDWIPPNSDGPRWIRFFPIPHGVQVVYGAFFRTGKGERISFASSCDSEATHNLASLASTIVIPTGTSSRR